MKTTSRLFYFLSSLSVILILPFLLQVSPALAQTTAQNSGAGSNSSYNWAGYVAPGGGYTSVSGTWTIPQVPASSSLTGDATWIGIGGVTGNDLIQVGTQALTGGSSTTYQAWYEMLPSFSQNISITVNPGDSITASIAESASNQWTISLRDNTNGQNFQTITPYTSSMGTAEWIEEMPSQGNGAFIPLDSFGTVQFTGAAAVRDGDSLTIAQSGATTMTMINTSSQALATPSGLGADDASFSVSRSTATPSTGATSGLVPRGRRGWGRVGVGVQGFGQMPGMGMGRRSPRLNQFSGGMSLKFFTRFSRER